MAEPPILMLREGRLTFGATDLFTSVSLSIQARDRLCLVGRNGTGKSTLLKVLAGRIELDGGERWVQPGTRLAMLAQEPDFGAARQAREAVLAGLRAEEQHLSYRADLLLEAVKLAPDLPLDGLSGGQRRRVAIAAALCAEPDILLLDEPTNHLDIEMIEWLEAELATFPGATVTISHDRTFLERLSSRTFWLDRGIVRSHDRGYADFDNWSERILEQERTEQAKLDKLIASETVWSRQGITARRKRNQGRLRRLYELRDQRAAQIKEKGSVSMELEAGEASGKRVIEAFNISKHFAGQPVIRDFSLRIQRGDKIGLVGANGAGKSTLVKLLVGELEPDSGSIKRGSNLALTYFDQARNDLDPNRSLWDTLADVGGDQILVGDRPRHVVSYLRDFLFDDRQARQPVGSLSGGERNRLLLAKKLAQPTNLMVMDEPTNDLDMDSLDLLQELLSEYDGTLLLVSHDRDFLDRIVTQTLWLPGDGRVEVYPGGYADARRQREAGQAVRAPAATTGSSTRPRVKATTAAAVARTSGLTLGEQKRLAELPQVIERVTTLIEQINSALADPELFRRDPKRFAALTEALSARQQDQDRLESEWLTLAERAEGS